MTNTYRFLYWNGTCFSIYMSKGHYFFSNPLLYHFARENVNVKHLNSAYYVTFDSTMYYTTEKTVHHIEK